ncbi:MAG: sodium/solute symporter [Treponema sp.]|nr:sodium/solute symporter [Treponema sp.]
MFIKIILLIVFFAIMIGVGVYSRKNATDVNGFVLGGRSVGPWLTAFAFGTSYFSAVVFIGYAGQFGWKYGISSTWIGLGNAFIGSLLAWVVMGRRTRIMTHHLDAKTMPDYFGKRFDSKALRITAAAIAFIFLIPYTASLYKGLSTLFGLAFDIPYVTCVIAMAVLTAVYVILGGYMATAINDFIQGIIMLGGIIAVIGAVLSGQGGFLSALKKLSDIAPDPTVAAAPLKEAQGMFASFFGPDPLNLLGVIILTSLGTWGLPQMVGKFYSIKSEKAVKTGTVVSTIFAVIISGGCYFLGGFGRLFDSPAIHGPKGMLYDEIIPQMLTTLPDILIGIVVVLVLSASMSTLSSLVLTSSSTLTLDMLKITCMKKADDKKSVLVMRIFIVFFIAISVIIALNPPTFIAQLMGYSWGALAGSFLAPFLYGLFSKKITRAAVWANFVWGVGLTVANIFGKFIASPINCGAVAMVGGLIIVPLISLITPKLDKAKVDDMFACYDEKVEVAKKMVLKEE